MKSFFSIGFLLIISLSATGQYCRIVGQDTIRRGDLYAGETRLKADTIPAECLAFLTLTATGNGTGVRTLRMKSYGDMHVILTGRAWFYTNPEGTAGKSKIWHLEPGEIRTIYVRCASGNALMIFHHADRLMEWGDYYYDGFAGTENCPSVGGDLSGFRNIRRINGIYENTLTGNLNNMDSLVVLALFGNNTVGGDLDRLNPAFERLAVWGMNTLHGDFSPLVNLTHINLYSYTYQSMNGDFTPMTKLIQFYIVNDSCRITGDVTGMTGMDFFEIRGFDGRPCRSALTGDISGMTAARNIWNQSPYNAFTGDISNLKGVTHFLDDSEHSSYSGAIDQMTSIALFEVHGSLHTLTGDPGLIAGQVLNLQLPSCHIEHYTPGNPWLGVLPGLKVIINPSDGYGLSSSEVDAILIDMAANPGFVIDVELRGANEPRTSASDTAVEILQARGCRVLTNEMVKW